ncbi:MAG: M28 family peptidase [Solirubrobacteraceae bacterium]
MRELRVDPRPATPAEEAILREVVEALAPLERGAGSSGERAAARWIARRLEQAGCEVAIEDEEFLDGYARLIGALAATGAGTGAVALTGRVPRLAALVAAAVTAAIADDISNGPRVFRRLAGSRLITQNVVARLGPPAAGRTLVVLAHHDAAPTGAIFDDRLQARLGEMFPGVLERIDTSIPLWWPLLGAPALVAWGAARRHRAMIAAGLLGSLLGAAVFGDIARSPIVPGANDNLSAVAVQVALAERLAADPPENLRVLLVSCGAEEVLQGGIHGFAARHFPHLDRERTWFLNLETLGSPRLALLEGEGPIVMEDYPDRSFRDLVVLTAEQVGAPLRRGMRSRSSTDSVIPSRAGYPTATLVSMDRFKALSNYHQMTDVPENLSYRTIRQALTVADALARELAVNPWIGR